MATTTNTVLMDIEAALQAAETVLPTVLGVVGVFSPAAAALVPFLPLLQVALNTVQQVESVLAGDTAGAVQAVTTALQNVPSQTPAAPAVSTNPTA